MKLEDINWSLRSKYYEEGLCLFTSCCDGRDGTLVAEVYAIAIGEQEEHGIEVVIAKDLIDECKKSGFTTIRLLAFPVTDYEERMIGKDLVSLIRGYESLGFRLDDPTVLDEIEDEREYIYSDFVSSLWMTLDLVEGEREC